MNKTGGSSTKDFLREVLGEESGEVVGLLYNVKKKRRRVHEALHDKRFFLGYGYFNSLKILTTIRNPYARLVSLYHARHRNYYEGGEEGINVLETLDKSFNDWIRRCVIGKVEILNSSLSTYLFVDNIIPPNVHMVRLENLEAGIKEFLKTHIGIETDLTMPHKNISKHGYFMDYYEDETREMVYKYDKYIIDVFYPEFKY